MSERMALFPEEWLREGNDWDTALVFPTWTVCCLLAPSSLVPCLRPSFASFPTGPRVVFLCRKEGVCVQEYAKGKMWRMRLKERVRITLNILFLSPRSDFA